MNPSPLLSRIKASVARLVTRGRVERVSDSAAPFQRLQVLGLPGEVLDDVHRLQPFGLYTVPRAGASVLLLEVGGARDHVVALLVGDEALRPRDGNPGDVVLHGESGTAVRVAADGTTTIEGPSGVVVTVSPAGDVTIAGGAVSVTGSAVTLDGSVQIDGKDFLAHTHPAGSLLDGLSAPCSGISGPVS